ncbi:hypothetical protein [Mycolicibacterium bacteremicum]|uniref:hypothetical protein n=1 Tax=Mycolicibacterium bacteremicum TaxID=564198 RepID=UPI001F45D065|nr:hypothetical protein [Mycolicibacterium bacteremicum]
MSKALLRRGVAIAALVVSAGFWVAPSSGFTASAEPPAPAAASPWPDIKYYDRVDALPFAVPGGVWFTTPNGQNCGIWRRGSFGCTGFIPGAPQGTRHIGWIDGDRAVHYDWTVGIRFPNSQAQLPLRPYSVIAHEGTTCAITPLSGTYCERGPMRFLIEPTRTWLSAPWIDLSWVQLGPASCSPPDTPGAPCYS